MTRAEKLIEVLKREPDQVYSGFNIYKEDWAGVKWTAVGTGKNKDKKFGPSDLFLLKKEIDTYQGNWRSDSNLRWDKDLKDI